MVLGQKQNCWVGQKPNDSLLLNITMILYIVSRYLFYAFFTDQPALLKVLDTKCNYLNNECQHYMEHLAPVDKFLILGQGLKQVS